MSLGASEMKELGNEKQDGVSTTPSAALGTFAATRIRNLLTLLGRRSSLTLADQVVVSITNFSATILIGRFCRREELGLYMLGYSLLLFAVAVQQMLISSPYILIRPRLNDEQAIRYTGGAYAQQLLLGCALCISLLLASFFCRGSRESLAIVLASLALSSPLFLLKEMFRRICFAHLDIVSALAMDCVICVIQVGLLVGLASKGILSASFANLCSAASCGVALALTLVLSRRRYAFSMQDMLPTLLRNWNTGRWIFGSQILWAGTLYLYPWLLVRLQGEVATGIWAACFAITNLGNPLLLGLQNYIEPKVSHAWAEGGVERMRPIVWKFTGVLTGTMLAFSALLLAAGNWLLTLLYGAKFAGNGITVFLLSLGFAAGAAGFAISCGYFVSGRGAIDLRISVVYPVVLLVCGLPLIRAHSVAGAAVSVLVAYLIASSLRALQFMAVFRRRTAPVLQAA